MLVKLKFRHEISRRDAQEGAGTERECVRGEVVPGSDPIDEEEQQNAQRNDQGEEEIDQHDACSRRSADTHDRRDLVEFAQGHFNTSKSKLLRLCYFRSIIVFA